MRTHLLLAGLFAALAGPAAAQLVFDSPTTADTGNLTLRLLSGDLNEDGLPDLVASHFVFGGPATVTFGTGPGQFGSAQTLTAVGSGRGVLRLADFDADGHLDLLAMIGQSPVTSLSVLLGNGDGTFGTPLGINGAFEAPVDADVGDFDADGALDVGIYNGAFGFSPGSVLAVFGQGDGSFDEPVNITPNLFPFGSGGLLRVGDPNGDGFDDVVITTGVSMPSILSNGDGSFTEAACVSGCFMLSGDKDFELADVNGDGRDDVVSPTRVLPANPGGTFGLGQALPTDGVPFTLALADFDADGALDILVGRNFTGSEFDPGQTTGDVRVLRGNGNATFQTPGVVVSHVPAPRDIAIADVDQDGRLDAVVGEFQTQPDTGRVLLNRTYGPGSPFLDLGGALGGSNGYPIQLASGTLLTGQPFAFKLASGPPNGSAWHIVGLSALNAPFKGGTMIPSITLVNGPFPLDAQGTLTLAGSWPTGGSGLTLWVQYWMPNGGGPLGFVASSGVRAQIP
jgi:hypothetical protein